LARVIQEHIKRPLADELLFGQLAKGGKVLVTISEDKPAFRFSPVEPRGGKRSDRPAEETDISEPVL